MFLCPIAIGGNLAPPAFTSTAFATQLCFFTTYGIAAFPATGCCGPGLFANPTCNPPSIAEWLPVLVLVPDQTSVYGPELTGGAAPIATPAPAGGPTAADEQLFAAAFSLLLTNMDLAMWAVCQVEQWSPEMAFMGLSDCMLDLFTPNAAGQLPLHVTYVGTFINRPTSTMAAFTFDAPASDGTVGFKIPVATNTWSTLQVPQWNSGGVSALCAAVQVASNLLHEMIHICADVPSTDPLHLAEGGALHEDVTFPCWDEARMVASIFLWAMAERYSCLTTAGPCQSMDDDYFFAYSVANTCQLRNSPPPCY